MRRTSTLWEVFVLRFEEALEGYRKRRLTADEAGEVLGMSGRHFRRMVVRYDEEGVEGLRDRRLGRRSPRRAPAGELTPLPILFPGRHPDFTGKHFHQPLQKRHDYKLGHTLAPLALPSGGPAPRKQSERRPPP